MNNTAIVNNGKLDIRYYNAVKRVLLDIVAKDSITIDSPRKTAASRKIVDVLDFLGIPYNYYTMFKNESIVAELDGRTKVVRYVRSRAQRFSKEGPLFVTMTDGKEAIRVFNELIGKITH